MRTCSALFRRDTLKYILTQFIWLEFRALVLVVLSHIICLKFHLPYDKRKRIVIPVEEKLRGFRRLGAGGTIKIVTQDYGVGEIGK